IQIVGAITTYWNVYLFQYLAFKVIQQLRIDAFNKIGKLGMRYFDKETGGSIVSRLTNDTEDIVEMFIGVFSSFLMSIYIVVFFCVFFFVIYSYVMFFIIYF